LGKTFSQNKQLQIAAKPSVFFATTWQIQTSYSAFANYFGFLLSYYLRFFVTQHMASDTGLVHCAVCLFARQLLPIFVAASAHGGTARLS